MSTIDAVVKQELETVDKSANFAIVAINTCTDCPYFIHKRTCVRLSRDMNIALFGVCPIPNDCPVRVDVR